MSRLGGLWRAMPWTASLFALGALAVAGLPPLNGFVSEWLVYLGLFDAATHRGATLWAVAPAGIMLAMAGALALASFVKAAAIVFLGAPRTQAAEHAHECGLLMRGPMATLAAVCVTLGLAPMLVWPAISRAAGAWDPVSSGTELPAPLVTLGLVQVTLAGIGIVAAAWLWRKATANGLQRALTWDCGYARPTARMQYTSGSFAGIGAGWFAWLLQPVRRVRRPRGLLPVMASWMERVPDTVLERVLTPASEGVLRVAGAVRARQHGRLQAYIFYVVAGLAATGILVLLGGWR
jgi:hydrogenase-4 component B